MRMSPSSMPLRCSPPSLTWPKRAPPPSRCFQRGRVDLPLLARSQAERWTMSRDDWERMQMTTAMYCTETCICSCLVRPVKATRRAGQRPEGLAQAGCHRRVLRWVTSPSLRGHPSNREACPAIYTHSASIHHVMKSVQASGCCCEYPDDLGLLGHGRPQSVSLGFATRLRFIRQHSRKDWSTDALPLLHTCLLQKPTRSQVRPT